MWGRVGECYFDDVKLDCWIGWLFVCWLEWYFDVRNGVWCSLKVKIDIKFDGLLLFLVV